MADGNDRTDAQNGVGGADRMAEAARNTAETLKQGTEKAHDAFRDHVVEPARRAGEALKVSGARVVEGGSAIGGKLLDQAEANTREAFAAMRAATSAKDWSEVMRIQGEFLREQGQRSMAQTREIGELIMQFGREAVTPLRGGEDDAASKP